jgi:hypothetical protein
MSNTAPPAASSAADSPAVAVDATGDSFDNFRSSYPLKPLPKERVANSDQVKEMLAQDGLMLWSTGPVKTSGGESSATPAITPEQDAAKLLWAIETSRIPYAPEQCAFGRALESRVIKHSNLTGGRGAHCAGEMVRIDDENIVVNGRSGRYGPKSAAEMLAVAQAFKASGYNVWSMGFDAEAGVPLPFIGVTPTRVS